MDPFDMDAPLEVAAPPMRAAQTPVQKASGAHDFDFLDEGDPFSAQMSAPSRAPSGPAAEAAQPRQSVDATALPLSTLIAGQEVTIVGKLQSVKNFPSGWGIGSVAREACGDISINGDCLSQLQIKTTYEFAGKIERHPKFGVQLKVRSAGIYVPANSVGLEKFLAQNYNGIGKGSAKKIIAYHQSSPGGLEAFRRELLANPYNIDSLVAQAGVKRKTSMDSEAGAQSLIYMDLATKIGGPDVGDRLLRKISKHYFAAVKSHPDPVAEAWSRISANPFGPIRELDGYGFKTADSIARKIGFDLTRDERLAAMATHAIDEGCNATGHVFLTQADFSKSILAIDPTVDVAKAIKAALNTEEPMIIDEGRYYTEKTHKAEIYLARSLADRYTKTLPKRIYSDAKPLHQSIKEAEQHIKLTLDESQARAVQGILNSNTHIHLITAGPGCGKTTIVELIVQVVRNKTIQLFDPDLQKMVEHPYKVTFCAPTGKAAKVLNSRISRFGLQAATIHSLLGVRGANDEEEGAAPGSFVFNHKNRLHANLIVIDETSMVDLVLMNALISAVPDDAHIILLGDPKQLPSVGPGSVLADFLKLPFDSYQLSKTHRNDGGILEVVTMAGHGRVDFAQRDDVHFIDPLPEATKENVQKIIKMYDDSLQACGRDFSRVGLLIARRKGDPDSPGWNTTYLNAVMREVYNPENPRRGGNVSQILGRAHAVPGEKVYGTRFRVGDRIIIRKNLAIKEDDAVISVVNGDTGSIIEYNCAKGGVTSVELRLDDGRSVLLPSSAVDTLEFAYAMTVHMAQGSEYERVFFICVNGHSSFVHRGIVFTGFSRAKKKLTILSDQQALKQIVARQAPSRNSHLAERFHEQVVFNKKKAQQGGLQKTEF